MAVLIFTGCIMIGFLFGALGFYLGVAALRAAKINRTIDNNKLAYDQQLKVLTAHLDRLKDIEVAMNEGRALDQQVVLSALQNENRAKRALATVMSELRNIGVDTKRLEELLEKEGSFEG